MKAFHAMKLQKNRSLVDTAICLGILNIMLCGTSLVFAQQTMSKQTEQGVDRQIGTNIRNAATNPDGTLNSLVNQLNTITDNTIPSAPPTATSSARPMQRSSSPVPLPGVTQPVPVAGPNIRALRINSELTQNLFISRTQPNKISTPFEYPQAIDFTGAALRQVGQDIYIQPVSDQPLTIYLTDGGVGQSFGITLVPKSNIPAQTIILLPDPTPGAGGMGTAPDPAVTAGDYVGKINALIRDLAHGKTPAGCNRSRLPATTVNGKELVIQPQFRYACSNWDLYSYRAFSKSDAPLEMDEDAFASESVRAVSFYPSALLQKGEDTNIFIVADRKQQGQQGNGSSK